MFQHAEHNLLCQALNPDIAIGQLEGGFIMAMGYLLTEEASWIHTSQTAEAHNLVRCSSATRIIFVAHKLSKKVASSSSTGIFVAHESPHRIRCDSFLELDYATE